MIKSRMATAAGLVGGRTRQRMILPMLLASVLGITAHAGAADDSAAKGAGSSNNQFADPLDHPAVMRSKIAERPFMAMTRAGSRLVAVGPRGMIALSDDSAASWRQAKVPVQSDLLAVAFPTAEMGWVVGHDGVVLHSTDGGATWIKQLDGRDAEKQFKQFYEAKAGAGVPGAKEAIATLEQNFKNGPSLPMLDVWFENESNGYAVGSFGMLISTRDGGKTWEPWLHHIDNPDQLNLNAIYGSKGNILIASERGKVYRYEPQTQRFIPTNTGYNGSFFGFSGNDNVLLTFGLRGIVYKSVDQGRAWQEVHVPGGAAISAGIIRSKDGGFILVNAAGDIIEGDKEAIQFRIVGSSPTPRLTGVTAIGKDAIALAGLSGLQVRGIAQKN